MKWRVGFFLELVPVFKSVKVTLLQMLPRGTASHQAADLSPPGLRRPIAGKSALGHLPKPMSGDEQGPGSRVWSMTPSHHISLVFALIGLPLHPCSLVLQSVSLKCSSISSALEHHSNLLYRFKHTHPLHVVSCCFDT